MNRRLVENWIKKNDPQGISKLSAKTEISPGTIRNVMKGRHAPDLETARKIAQAIGVSLDELCGSSQDGRPPAA